MESQLEPYAFKDLTRPKLSSPPTSLQVVRVRESGAQILNLRSLGSYPPTSLSVVRVGARLILKSLNLRILES